MRVRTLVAALTCALLPLTACSSGSSSGDAKADNTPATPATATPTTAPPPADPVAVAAWFKDSRHRTGLKSLDANLASYTSGTATSDAGTIRSACNYLTHDLRILKTFEPIPDLTAQASWSSALTDLEQGAADCSTGSLNGDTAQAAKAKAEITKGDREYGAVVDRLGVILGQKPTSSPT